MTMPGGRPALIPLILVCGVDATARSALLTSLRSTESCTHALMLAAMQGSGRFAASDAVLTIEPDRHGIGCLCCSGSGDWLRLLERILRDRDNDRLPAFDRLIVEAGDNADPAALFGVILGHPYLALRFAPAGVITLVAADAGLAALERDPAAQRQVAAADHLVIHGRGNGALHDGLRTLAPEARILAWDEAASGRHLPQTWHLNGKTSPEVTRRTLYRAALARRTDDP